MAHDKVYGVCENKCFVEVPTKEQFEGSIPKLKTINENKLVQEITEVGFNCFENVSSNDVEIILLYGFDIRGVVIQGTSIINITPPITPNPKGLCTLSPNETVIILRSK